MPTLNNEQVILERFRFQKCYHYTFNGRLLRCLHIKHILNSKFFNKLWVDSSGKRDKAPDFYSDRLKLSLEVMRIDDSVGEIDGKHVKSSFERAGKLTKQYFDKKDLEEKNINLFIIPDTTNLKEFNLEGYKKNFKRVLFDHSDKIPQYKRNHPKCKKIILFICDESDPYIEFQHKEDLFKKGSEPALYRPHVFFADNYFLNIIKSTAADYVVWYGMNKILFSGGKLLPIPTTAIFDVKHMRKGIDYKHDFMKKVTDQHGYE